MIKHITENVINMYRICDKTSLKSSVFFSNSCFMIRPATAMFIFGRAERLLSVEIAYLHVKDYYLQA